MGANLKILLERYLDGNRSALDRLFESMRRSELFLPLEEVEGDEKEVLRVARFHRRSSRLLPVFFDQDSCSRWAGQRYITQAMPGRFLLESSKGSSRFFLQPGHQPCLELSIAQMFRLREDPSDDFVLQLRKTLRSVFEANYQVEEAYLLSDTLEENAQLEELSVAVGIYAPDSDADKRFRLVNEIALISKRFFGYAGAIEIFDDLDVSSSRSWELFQMAEPFYDRSNSHVAKKKQELNTERIVLGSFARARSQDKSALRERNSRSKAGGGRRRGSGRFKKAQNY